MLRAIKQFSNGLFLGTPADASPEGTLRRARGLHPLSNGSARSRWGSTALYTLNAHSITYFNDLWHFGVGAELYRESTSIYAGLAGARLSFVRMPPVAGIVDYLFVVGGGSLVKVDPIGAVSNWGIARPSSGPTVAAAAGGALVAGTYRYQITYYNTNTGQRSNGNGVDVEGVTTGANLTLALTNIPASSDSQVTHVEIWRSEGNGTLLFRLNTRLAVGTDFFNDDGSVELLDTELPTDNLVPYSWFTSAAFWNASAFWITSTQSGERGRLYYSPVGRCESMQGFLNVTNDADPLIGLFTWGGKLGVVSRSRAFEIIGTNPYEVRELSGVPGTNTAETVALTPAGIFYEAADGVRSFTGTSAPLAFADAIQRIFRGESVENLTAFTGLVATYARNEYFLSDGAQTLAVNVERGTWRDLGVGCNALFYEPENDVLAATVGGNVVALEAEGTATDAGTAIPLSIEPAHIRADRARCYLVHRALVDINDGAQALAATLLADGTELALGQTSASAIRTINEFAIERIMERVGLRVSGSLSAAVELFEIDFDVEEVALYVNMHTESDIARTQLVVPGRLVNGTSLKFTFDSSLPLLSTRQYVVLERLFIDANTNNSTITPTITMVERSFPVGPIKNSQRGVVDIPINKAGRLVEITLAGGFSTSVRLYRIELDVYLSKGD